MIYISYIMLFLFYIVDAFLFYRRGYSFKKTVIFFILDIIKFGLMFLFPVPSRFIICGYLIIKALESILEKIKIKR